MAVQPYGTPTAFYGDNTRFWGERPMPHGRKEHVALTVGGTAINADAKSHRIRSFANSLNDRYEFDFRNVGLSSIDEHDEVILVGSDAQGHKFAGFVDTFESYQEGPDFIYTVSCASYAKLLLDANKRITRVYESGTADSTILADLGDDVKELDFTTHVATIESSLEREYFENLTPLQIIRRVCERTGGKWRVDYGPAGAKKAHFHYWDPGNEPAAPWELASIADIASIDYITYFPVHDFKHKRRHGKCTTVIVEGSPSFVTLGKTGRGLGEADGVKKRFDLPYLIYARYPEAKPLIWDSDNNALKVGYADVGQRLGDGNYEVHWRPDRLYLEFAVAPSQSPSYAFYYDAAELRPTGGPAYAAKDQASILKYGKEIVLRVKDESVHDSATAALVAAELLSRYKAALDTYTGYVMEHGLEVGDSLPVTDTARSLSREAVVIQSIDAEVLGDAKWKYSLVLNDAVGTDLDVIHELSTQKLASREYEKKQVDQGWVVEVLDGNDPVISFRIIESGGAADDKFSIGVDDTDEKFKIDVGSLLGDYADLELGADGQLELIGAGTNVRPILTLTAYNVESPAIGTWSPQIHFRRSLSATPGTLATTPHGYNFGRIVWEGVDGSGNWAVGSYMDVRQDGTPGANNVSGRLRWLFFNNDGDDFAYFRTYPELGNMKLYTDQDLFVDARHGNLDLYGGVNVDISAPAGKCMVNPQLHVEQGDPSAGIPVLILDQADVDQPFVGLVGQSLDGDLTYSLVEEGDQGSQTRKGFALIDVEDVGDQIPDGEYYLEFWTLNP